jgi:hypothetical protein
MLQQNSVVTDMLSLDRHAILTAMLSLQTDMLSLKTCYPYRQICYPYRQTCYPYTYIVPPKTYKVIILENPDCASQKTRRVSVMKTKRKTLFREKITAYSENHHKSNNISF